MWEKHFILHNTISESIIKTLSIIHYLPLIYISAFIEFLLIYFFKCFTRKVVRCSVGHFFTIVGYIFNLLSLLICCFSSVLWPDCEITYFFCCCTGSHFITWNQWRINFLTGGGLQFFTGLYLDLAKKNCC